MLTQSRTPGPRRPGGGPRGCRSLDPDRQTPSSPVWPASRSLKFPNRRSGRLRVAKPLVQGTKIQRWS
jgi:hypothetical protein